MYTSFLLRWLLIFAGVCALVLGIVGVVVPLLPTTPFLLLAATCFIRSSDRLYTWLIHHRWLGSYIRNYREHRAMTLRAKIIALTLLWVVLGHSAIMVAGSWGLRLLLAAVGAGVTAHLLCLKTVPRSGAPRPSPVDGDSISRNHARHEKIPRDPVCVNSGSATAFPAGKLQEHKSL